MVRNTTFLVAAVFLSFAAGSYAQDAIANAVAPVAVDPAVVSPAVATPTASTPVVAPTEVTLAAASTEVTVTLASDVTTATGDGSPWASITNGLWLVLLGVAALIAVWWKKRSLASKPQDTPKP